MASVSCHWTEAIGHPSNWPLAAEAARAQRRRAFFVACFRSVTSRTAPMRLTEICGFFDRYAALDFEPHSALETVAEVQVVARPGH